MIPRPLTLRPLTPAPLFLSLLLGLAPAAALAGPDLDDRRSDALDEMARRIDRWRAEAPPQPPPSSPDARAPAAEPPAAPPDVKPAATKAPANEPPANEPPAATDPLDAPVPLGAHDPARIRQAVLDATNRARAAHGLPPLAPHPILDAAAADYAAHLAGADFFGHIDPHRPAMKTPGDRVKAAGGLDPVSAENLITEGWLQVADGERMLVIDPARHLYAREEGGPPIPPHTHRSLAASMVDRWLASPGHRRNLLDPEARQVGFGMAWQDQGGLPTLIGAQVFQRYQPLNPPADAR